MCPRTREQEESRLVTNKVTEVVSPVGKRSGRSTAREMKELEVPSKRQRVIGVMGYGVRWRSANFSSMKQCVEPESMRVRIGEVECIKGDVSDKMSALGFERADALSRHSVIAQLGSTQSTGCAECCGLRTNFLSSRRNPRVSPQSWTDRHGKQRS